jgi:hypothetical protein
MHLEIVRAERDKHTRHFDEEAPSEPRARTAWRV